MPGRELNAQSGPCAADPGFAPTPGCAECVTTGPALASGLPGGVTDWDAKNVHLQGDFTVDVPLFRIRMGSVVRLDAGMKIIVLNGSVLQIKASTISNCDDSMWETIEVRPGGTVRVVSNALVENAGVGIACQGTGSTTGTYEVNRSRLMNNRIGIHVSDYEDYHPGTVEDSEIAAPNLIAPFAGQMGYAGMLIEDVGSTGDIAVGRTSEAYDDATPSYNWFHDLEFGIYADESDVRVQNNLFEDIREDLTPGGGIAVAYTSTVCGGALQVGAPDPGVTGVNNRFEDCEIGVVALRPCYAYILDNEFVGSFTPPTDASMQGGVSLRQVREESLVIGNLIEEFQFTGVEIRQQDGRCRVTDNTIRNVGITTTYSNDVTGIVMQNAVGGSSDFIIRRNDIDKMHRGIIVANTAATVGNNDVDFFWPGDPTMKAVGIRMQNTSGETARVDTNRIDGGCPSCSDPFDVIGIRFVTTPGFLATYNDVTECGVGVSAENPCPAGNFICNTLDDCVYGFVLDNMPMGGTDIGPVASDQALLTPSDNAWYPTMTANRTFTSNNTEGDDIDWIYRDNYGFHYDMEIAGVTLNMNDVSSTPVDPDLNNALVPCGIPPLESSGSGSFDETDMTAAGRDHLLGAHRVLIDSPFYDPCRAPYNQRMVYDLLADRPGLLDLDEPSDFAYQSLWHAIRSGWVDEFREFEALWREDDRPGAASVLSTITSTCPADIALRRTYGLMVAYADSSLSIAEHRLGENVFQPLDHAWLLTTARADPVTLGPAVYVAQAMLDTLIEYEPPVIRQHAGVARGRAELVISPNPVGDLVTLHSTEILPAGTHVVVSTSTGLPVQTVETTGTSTHLTLALPGLEAGWYHVTVHANGMHRSGSFIVAK